MRIVRTSRQAPFVTLLFQESAVFALLKGYPEAGTTKLLGVKTGPVTWEKGVAPVTDGPGLTVLLLSVSR